MGEPGLRELERAPVRCPRTLPLLLAYATTRVPMPRPCSFLLVTRRKITHAERSSSTTRWITGA